MFVGIVGSKHAVFYSVHWASIIKPMKYHSFLCQWMQFVIQIMSPVATTLKYKTPPIHRHMHLKSISLDYDTIVCSQINKTGLVTG